MVALINISITRMEYKMRTNAFTESGKKGSKLRNISQFPFGSYLQNQIGIFFFDAIRIEFIITILQCGK